MTAFEFRCALASVASLAVAALASGAGRPVALFLSLCAAGLSLFMWRRSKNGKR